MKKIHIKNCQRIIDSTEFNLTGLSFLVGPNNAGKGVIKDALKFLGCLFQGNTEVIESNKESLKRAGLQAKDVSSQLYPDLFQDSSTDATVSLENLFESESAWSVGFETDIKRVFAGRKYFDKQLSDEHHTWGSACEDWDDSTECWDNIRNNSIKFTYSEALVKQFPDDFIEPRIWREVRIDSNDQNILTINDVEALVNFESLHLIGSTFFPDYDTFSFTDGFHKKPASGAAEIARAESDEFAFEISREKAIVTILDLGEILKNGRYRPPEDWWSRAGIIDQENETSADLREVELLIDRLIGFVALHAQEFFISGLVPGDRTLPSEADLKTIISVEDQCKRILEIANAFPQRSVVFNELQSHESLRELSQILIIDEFRRNPLLRDLAAKGLPGPDRSDAPMKLQPLRQANSMIDLVREDFKTLFGEKASINIDCSFEIVSLKLPKGLSNKTQIDPYNAKICGTLELLVHKNTPVRFQDVGSGIGYLFPALILLANVQTNGVSIIEQPELHLHPRMQGDLGDLIFKKALNVAPLVIETHSENLIIRILRRVKEEYNKSIKAAVDSPEELSKALAGSDLRFYYFDPISDNETKVHSLNVSPSGAFYEPWPDGFFEEKENDFRSLL